jgi:hypothetical protein
MTQEPETRPAADKAALELGQRVNREAAFWACNYGQASWLAEGVARAVRRLLRRPRFERSR